MAGRGLPLDAEGSGGERGLVLAGAPTTAGIWRRTEERGGEGEIVGVFWSFYFLLGSCAPPYNDIISGTEGVQWKVVSKYTSFGRTTQSTN
jgi:hypothetical protein